jgi:hypothetical protein
MGFFLEENRKGYLDTGILLSFVACLQFNHE